MRIQTDFDERDDGMKVDGKTIAENSQESKSRVNPRMSKGSVGPKDRNTATISCINSTNSCNFWPVSRFPPPSHLPPRRKLRGFFWLTRTKRGHLQIRINGANIVAVGSCVMHIRYMIGVGLSLDAIRCSLLPVGVTVLAVQRKINR